MSDGFSRMQVVSRSVFVLKAPILLLEGHTWMPRPLMIRGLQLSDTGRP